MSKIKGAKHRSNMQLDTVFICVWIVHKFVCKQANKALSKRLTIRLTKHKKHY